MKRTARSARIRDVHDLALGMPHAAIYPGSESRPAYQVGGKSFVFFRNPRPDAFDPETGERYDDVIVFWVPNEGDKKSLARGTARSDAGLTGGWVTDAKRRKDAPCIPDVWRGTGI